MDRNEAIKRIRAGLQARTGKTWSVTGGRGTSWGWIRIEAPPARRVDGRTSPEDRAELAEALDLEAEGVHCDGVSIPASDAYRAEYVARAEGRVPEQYGTPYWD